MQNPEWNEAERELLRSCMKNKVPVVEIAKQITALGFANRTGRAVQTQKAAMLESEGHAAPNVDRSKQQDEKFQAALMAAIHAGHETAPIGIVRNELPMVPHSYEREPMVSLCSSSASLCAEA